MRTTPPTDTGTGSVDVRPPRSTDDWHQATALLHDYVEWLRAAVGVEPLDEQPAIATELADLAAVYDGRAARLFLAFDGPLAVGMVAVRPHDDGTAELKRLYLRPVARGRGLADRLVEQAVQAAADGGHRAIWLESMRGVMEPALAVYRRHGFGPAGVDRQTIVLDGMVVLERPVEPTPVGR
ncbi:MAG: GNAT family N-acetyltransferase [Actinomycetota bacterium]